MTFAAKVLVRVLAALLWLLLAGTAVAGHKVVAVEGQARLPAGLDQAVTVEGDWGFAWQRFVAPDWQALPTRAFAPVPSSWNNLAADGKPPGQDGWGSFVLRLDCPAGQSLAVEAPGQRTASRLFVNGVEVATHGRPGPSPEASEAAVHNRIPISREFPCPLRLTLHLSNFDHRAGGFVRPVLVGPADALARQRESRVIYASALLAAYWLTGVVALGFFALRRREITPLVFGLSCLAMGVYTDSISERLLLRGWPGPLSWAAYMRIEYLSWIAAMALFLQTMRTLFPRDIPARPAYAVLALLGAGVAAVLALPPAVYSHVVMPGQVIAVAVAAWLAVALMRTEEERGDARVLMAGLLAVLAALAIDLLLLDDTRPDRKFLPAGFALFMLSPAVVIGRRLSQALNAEERALTLEENARLREDVERISRHDLKTPLNSILGVSRLLRDQPGLTGHQRELVNVLQGAGLRMLELVNLSLDLFKMETGSYVFQPQPVDLREVVTRVLVDLHPLAEFRAVVLHMPGPAREPVRVHAEELLCYSIIANLVKNAIEAAGPGRKVTVTLQPGDPVTLLVHNPGEVPPAAAERFFQKYSTAGKQGGTGLGTYSARLMARAQQGDLQVRSSAQEGTTLVLSLRPSPGAPMAPAAVPARAAQPGLSRHVLLVDDDEFNRFVTRQLLPSPPLQVETAADGRAAIRAMSQRWPDVVLLDMEMPVMDGLETLAWIRQQEAAGLHPRCRVVMLSGNDDDASRERAMAAGADGFLAKPIARERLLASLDAALERAA